MIDHVSIEAHLSGSGVTGPSDDIPAAPTLISVIPGDGSVSLIWNASPEGDVVSDSLYRRTRSAPFGAPIAEELSGTSFSNTEVNNGTLYIWEAKTVRLLWKRSAPDRVIRSGESRLIKKGPPLRRAFC